MATVIGMPLSPNVATEDTAYLRQATLSSKIVRQLTALLWQSSCWRDIRLIKIHHTTICVHKLNLVSFNQLILLLENLWQAGQICHARLFTFWQRLFIKRWKILLYKCQKLAKVAGRVSIRVTNKVQVSVIGEAAIFNQSEDFGILWMPPCSLQYVLHCP